MQRITIYGLTLTIVSGLSLIMQLVPQWYEAFRAVTFYVSALQFVLAVLAVREWAKRGPYTNHTSLK